jgi:nucleotide-binding universal stress UspA family protein
MQAKTIVLPIDFSTNNDNSLALATSLARDSGAKLFIVHVEEPPIVYVGNSYYGVPNPQAEDVSKMLKEVVPTASDVAYEHQSLTGTPADAIVKFAEQTQADFIVMGTHGRTGLSRVLMGSVAEAVVRQAPCPLLSVKQPAAQAKVEQKADQRERSESPRPEDDDVPTAAGLKRAPRNLTRDLALTIIRADFSSVRQVVEKTGLKPCEVRDVLTAPDIKGDIKRKGVEGLTYYKYTGPIEPDSSASCFHAVVRGDA